jgi:HK97 family phage portal protein
MSGGTLVTPDTAMQVSAFYRGVIYISTQIAKLPIEIKNVENERFRNKIYKLLNKRPNPETNAFNFKATQLQTAIVNGNSYAEIERTVSGEPVNLWPIPENHCIPQRTVDGELVYKIVNGRDGTVYLPKEDVLHFRSIHSLDGVLGQGVAAYAKEVLGISAGADKFANSMFSNSGIPSGVLQSPGKLSDEAYNRIRDSWKDQMGGRKTGGTAVLEEGMTYNSVSLAPDVLQFLESRQFNVFEIARFLGVPPTKLYDPETQKYGTVEQSGLDVANDTISVWAVNIENEIDTKLLVGRYGALESSVDLYQLFSADMDTRATYYNKLMQVAAMTPNQIREKEGLQPYAEGDRYFIATNNFSPMDRIDEIIDKQVSNEPTGFGDEGVAPEPADTNQGGVENKLEDVLTKYYEAKAKKLK